MTSFSNQARIAMVGALLIHLTGCGGGGSSPSQSNNPPAPAPAPAPPPPPPPPPPPAVPPLSSTVVDLDDNHQVGELHWPGGNTSTGANGTPIAGLTCETKLSETYHVHTHVSVFLDGVALAFPRFVGRVQEGSNPVCFYSLHTHDWSGKIHVEAPAPGTFTLGQLFEIWGMPLQSDNVAGLTGKPIVVYSTEGGVVTEVTTDWKAIELTTHKEVTIQVGTPITEIPNFFWSAH